MTSIYQKILGEQFAKLHPKLQKRYSLTKEQGFLGKGEMSEVSGGNFLIRKMFHLGVPYRVFFPERGKDIPFMIENKVSADGLVQWNRTFSFDNQQRHFDAVMFLDEGEEVIIDWFGKPPILGSTLAFEVNDGTMVIRSLNQWLMVKGKRLLLPRLLQGKATIIESYDELADHFTIKVEVTNALLGTLFFYRGSFKEVAVNEKE
jgi:hypothetical protein